MSKPLLLETDVLIDYLREQSEAVTYICSDCRNCRSETSHAGHAQ